MTKLLFAANWKMHLGPKAAADFCDAFLDAYTPVPDRSVWFFPPAISVTAVLDRVKKRPEMAVGGQNIYWEPKGAFTGELSAPMLAEAGCGVVLVGHSERRHVFGETDDETARKVRAALEAGLVPVLCVGEKIEQRKADETLSVVTRQLGAALNGLSPDQLSCVVIAYEPVWAIGTGLNATPEDASLVHGSIRTWMRDNGAPVDSIRVLYGGSVKPANAASLIAAPDVDGVLVGGASLEPVSWNAIVRAGVD